MEQVKRLFDVPYYQLEKYPKTDALCTKVNGEWVKYSTQEFISKANLFSRGLLALGVQPGDKIALISSNNRSEWNICDIGILQIGAIDVPVYPTICAADYKFIFNDAQVKFCFVSDKELYDKVYSVKNEIPSLKEIYTFNKVDGTNNWLQVMDAGMKTDIAEVEKLKAHVKEDDLATLIYTSGTTGVPKGVMLSHKNIVSNAKACIERLPVDSKGKSLSFLPVCHVYERMLHYLYMLTGVSIYFAESLDTVGDNLREVKPDVFTAVPRLLEKVYDKIIAKGEELSGIKRKLFFWAVSLGQEYDVVGKSAWYGFKLAIARKLIFKKWQAALGGNAKAVASGSAALQPRLARVFLAAGIPVMEGYGLTETSPVVAVNCQTNNAVRIGTVGIPIKDVQVKFAEDGEILIKGPNVMMGYYNRPDLTAEVIDSEGWLHTGDIGEMAEGKFLKITDRKKEIFKTSGGKYIAPQIMENKFKESRFIEQIMVIGENQKHPAALVVPAFVFVKEWAARKNISGLNTNQDIINNAQVKDRIWQEIEELNKNFGHWEEVKKIELLPNEWGVDTGELTPTLKLKRKFILDKYKDIVARIYN